jgi:hypothetical protein
LTVSNVPPPLTLKEEGEEKGEKGMNWKLQRHQPNAPTVLPYIKGTETGHFYLVLGETSTFIYGFRPLAQDVPPLGSVPTNGTQTRVRVVPKDAGQYDKFGTALSILEADFIRKDPQGDGFIHFSTVTSEPAKLISRLEKLLTLL